MTSAARYFVPVCLYPHTRYRTNAGVAALFEKYELSRHDHLIVVADRLLVLDRLMSGRHWTIGGAFEKARRRVAYWDEIAETAQFAEFAQRLRSEVLADSVLSAAIEEFVDRRVKRFGLGSAPDRERDYEREYLLSEVCMSVFCTEVLGFSTEVWECPPAPDVSDPLKLLYSGRVDLVGRVTARPAARVLNFLYDDPRHKTDSRRLRPADRQVDGRQA